MKSLRILFVVLLVISACQSRKEYTILADVESYIQERPDSALSILEDFSLDSYHNSADKAHFALLSTIARDKCYYEIQPDSVVLYSYNFYKSHGKRVNYMKAAYYLGVARQNVGLYSEAAYSFLEAGAIAKQYNEFHYSGLISWHLCDIYSSNYDYARAMEYARNALASFSLANEELYITYSRLEIARLLIAEEQFNEAKSSLAAIMIESTDNDVVYSEAARQMARVLLLQSNPDYTAAFDCLSNVIDKNAVRLSSEDLGNLAIVYEGRGMHELADSYLKKEQDQILSQADSAIFHNIAHSVYSLRGEDLLAASHQDSAFRIQNRVVYKQLEQSVTHGIESLYHSNYLLEQSKNRLRLLVFICISVFMLFAIALLSFLLYKSRLRTLEDMSAIQEIENELENNRLKGIVFSETLDNMIRDIIMSLNELAQTYFSWDYDKLGKKRNEEELFRPEDVFYSFRREVGHLRKNQHFIHSIENALNISGNDIMNHCRVLLPKLKEDDYKMLVLFFSGFSVKSISFLFNMSEPAVRMRKTRYKQMIEALPNEDRALFAGKLG